MSIIATTVIESTPQLTSSINTKRKTKSDNEEKSVKENVGQLEPQIAKNQLTSKLDTVISDEDLTDLDFQSQLAQSVYLLNCNPHPIVDAYSYALEVKSSIPELQKRFGDKNISVLLRFHLIDNQGDPQIPIWSDSSDPKAIVRGAAARHEVLEFARPLLQANPKLSAKSIGSEVAERFGVTTWTDESKHKIGGSLRSWIFWLEEEERRTTASMSEEDIINEILRNGGISSSIRLLLTDGSYRSHGRRPIFNALGFRIINRLITEHGLKRPKIADLLGIGNSTVYKYFPGP